jgi:hypothetical protein
VYKNTPIDNEIVFNCTHLVELTVIFIILFFISNVVYTKKVQRGATLVHEKYTRECLIRRRKENKKTGKN